MASPKQFSILRSLGYSAVDIANMTPEEAYNIIKNHEGGGGNTSVSKEEMQEPIKPEVDNKKDSFTKPTNNAKMNYLDVKKQAKEQIKEAGTYSLDGFKAESFDDGYQFSFERSKVKLDNEETDKLVNRFKSETKGGAYLGVFEGDPEISFHTKDLKQAMQIAKEYNQISIWDWKELREIPNPDYDPNKGDN